MTEINHTYNPFNIFKMSNPGRPYLYSVEIENFKFNNIFLSALSRTIKINYERKIVEIDFLLIDGIWDALKSGDVSNHYNKKLKMWNRNNLIIKALSTNNHPIATQYFPIKNVEVTLLKFDQTNTTEVVTFKAFFDYNE